MLGKIILYPTNIKNVKSQKKVSFVCRWDYCGVRQTSFNIMKEVFTFMKFLKIVPETSPVLLLKLS